MKKKKKECPMVRVEKIKNENVPDVQNKGIPFNFDFFTKK